MSFSKLSSQFIGSGGVAVTKVRKTHNVNIHFPQMDSLNHHEMVVVGCEHLVCAAIKEILNIVEDIFVVVNI